MAKLTLFSTRAAAIAANIASDITEIRTSGYTSASDGGGATYAKAGSQPSHPGKLQSTDGAWWEMVFQDGGVNVKQFGAVGDGTADDWQAFENAKTFLGAKAVSSTLSGSGTGELRIPTGIFRLAQRFDIKAAGAFGLIGSSGSAYGEFSGTVLKFDASTAGIVVQAVNTINDTNDNGNGVGTGCRIENLTVLSAGGSGNFDGIRLRTAALIRNVIVRGFPRDGINIVAAAGSGGAIEGNANLWRMEGVSVVWNKRHGLYVDSADANAGYAVGINAMHNGRWGIYDSSFLGNTYVGCHCSVNGVLGPGETPNVVETSMVSYGGNRYCVKLGQDTAASTTTPGTDESVWAFVSVGGVHSSMPAWVSGGTYCVGGAYCSDEATAANIFLGCYSEGDQGVSQVAFPSIIVGGLHGAGFAYNSRGALVQESFRAQGGTDSTGSNQVSVTVGGAASNGDLLKFDKTGFEEARLKFSGNDIRWDRANADSSTTFYITGPSTAFAFGRSAAVPDAFLSNKLFIGSGDAARNITSAAAAPTTGAYARGDIVYNNAPTASGKVGWVCVTAGSPGTWKPFGAIDA